ncbi:tRNA 2-selenouridine(34) synthase MnmH [Pseudooctadecabacter jejudonensis]|uniref:tRNA 2-selenouridine synthase n=1 Tax=Pseudooctadecabacter jejudonensis TaxID=1391910 RepID=A0A1Y5S6X9_9RHOB|nr:tRNA 2-selenouridine(34) synthase MnmH [Pseudooctadecabacter jejudonensis]SLN31208.1 tRNA 2-selenouridine synthase [Pseudooctadecabacter jejudonensis]
MGTTFTTLAALLNHGYDTVIDVRSPAEFAEDHVPGAINLPALSNAERAEVGTIYVQDDPFKARKIGAALVARNVAAHLQGPLADKDGGWRPLVYCWRGGQRSGSFASILQQIGWRADMVTGGYQTFRGLVHQVAYEDAVAPPVILLDGNTGTAKTDVLHRLTARGVQTLDLEGLAHHRGSLLGGYAEAQPAQKAFETAIAVALTRADPTRPIIVEAESSKVGDCIIPPTLWAAMKAAPRIAVDAPLKARADFLTQAYADLTEAKDVFAGKLEALRRHRGKTVDVWLDLLARGEMSALACALMEDHYDPAYRTARARHAPQVLATFEAATLDPAGRDRLAADIADWIKRR